MAANQITVPFHGNNLFVIQHNNEPYTPMKQIVEGMGLSWQGQHAKLSTNSKRWGIKEILIPSIGGNQETICLPLRKLPGWLMSIHPNKVREEIREKVILYQNECDDVLWRYWTEGRAEKPKPKVIVVKKPKIPIQHRCAVTETEDSGIKVTKFYPCKLEELTTKKVIDFLKKGNIPSEDLFKMANIIWGRIDRLMPRQLELKA